jgi:hypothetical protein
MKDALLYEKASELVDQYHVMFVEHGIEITIRRRVFEEDVDPCGIHGALEYILIKKKIEAKKYHGVPNRYRLLVLQVHPISKLIDAKKDAKENDKQYAFSVYRLFRAKHGDKPIEWQPKEQAVLAKIEKRLKKLLGKAKRAASPNWCSNTLWDALRYSNSRKYNYIESYCGKSRDFWEMLELGMVSLPFLLFAVVGALISVFTH